jgi:integrase
VVPRIRRLEEPQGRLRWLTPEEEGRLLAECRRSRNPELYAITVVALETGMRQGEVSD